MRVTFVLVALAAVAVVMMACAAPAMGARLDLSETTLMAAEQAPVRALRKPKDPAQVMAHEADLYCEELPKAYYRARRGCYEAAIAADVGFIAVKRAAAWRQVLDYATVANETAVALKGPVNATTGLLPSGDNAEHVFLIAEADGRKAFVRYSKTLRRGLVTLKGAHKSLRARCASQNRWFRKRIAAGHCFHSEEFRKDFRERRHLLARLKHRILARHYRRFMRRLLFIEAKRAQQLKPSLQLFSQHATAALPDGEREEVVQTIAEQIEALDLGVTDLKKRLHAKWAGPNGLKKRLAAATEKSNECVRQISRPLDMCSL